jgi:hypothetical protein
LIVWQNTNLNLGGIPPPFSKPNLDKPGMKPKLQARSVPLLGIIRNPEQRDSGDFLHPKPRASFHVEMGNFAVRADLSHGEIGTFSRIDPFPAQNPLL